MDPKELAAIEACRSGRLDAFGDLYDQYAERIYRFIYFKTFHKETAEDLTSEVFTKALEHIETFDTSKGTFSSWIYRIARNAVIDHYRTTHPIEDMEDDWDFASSADVERDAHANLQLEKIQDALKVLKREQREVVIMRLWDGLSHQEIASILGITEANAKQIFCRTVRQLREELGSVIMVSFIVFAATIIHIK